MTQAMITTIVPWTTCARLGHSTFCSSAQDSRTKRPRWRGSRRPVWVEGGWHAGPHRRLAAARALRGGLRRRGARALPLVAALPTGLAGH